MVMSNLPLLTIVIATYNSGKTIYKALQSVKDQRFQDWECIIVDGSSKDNTLEIVKEFVNEDSRFRYISEPDDGIYDAYNKGWKNSRGEWIYYLGSDDWLTENGVKELMNYAKQDIDILCSSIFLYHVDGSISKISAYNGKSAYHQGVIMKKNLIARLGGFNVKYKILADSDLLVRAILAECVIKESNCTPIAYFTQGGTSSNLGTLIQTSKEKYRIYRNSNLVGNPTWETIVFAIQKLKSMIYRSLRKKLNFTIK